MDVDTARALIPTGLVQSPVLIDGEGQQWLADLPQLIVDSCRRWSLQVDDAATASHGAHAVVVPVSRHGRPLVLKVSHRGEDPRGEVVALRAWSGRGAVRLEEADEGGDVLLLERLDASRTLLTCPAEDVGYVAGHLIRELSVPAPPGMTPVRVHADWIAESVQRRQEQQGRPLPQRWVDEAARLAQHRRSVQDAGLLVHSDLTANNVLYRWGPSTQTGKDVPGEGRWVAIDPKPLVGSPERAVPELMWTLLDHLGAVDPGEVLHQVVTAGGLDGELARDWVVMRAVDYWLWAHSVGLTTDPQRCRRLLEAVCP